MQGAVAVSDEWLRRHETVSPRAPRECARYAGERNRTADVARSVASKVTPKSIRPRLVLWDRGEGSDELRGCLGRDSAQAGEAPDKLFVPRELGAAVVAGREVAPNRQRRIAVAQV